MVPDGTIERPHNYLELKTKKPSFHRLVGIRVYAKEKVVVLRDSLAIYVVTKHAMLLCGVAYRIGDVRVFRVKCIPARASDHRQARSTPANCTRGERGGEEVCFVCTDS